MTSTVRIYRYTDASAPAMSGTVGSLLAVLDACLVNGYGALPAAGWTKPFANTTNKGCYRNSPTDGTGFHLYVDDSGPGAGAAREARCTGFQTMSALGVGTGQFPTAAQMLIGTGAAVCRKSTTADATSRPWYLVADNTVFYLFVETGDMTGSMYNLFFGDFISYTPNDPNRCLLIGRCSENNSAPNSEWSGALNGLAGNTWASPLVSTLSGHYLAGNFTGVGGSMPFGKHSDLAKLGVTGFGSYSGTTVVPNTWATGYVGSNYGGPNAFPYPNMADGGLWMAPIWIHHTGTVRGYMKGLWCPCHNLPLTHGDTFNGTGTMSAKSFIALNSGGFTNNQWIANQFFVETSNTWS